MTCDACVKLIRLYITRMPGVIDAEVSREHSTLQITSETPLTVEAVQSALANTPYQVTQ